MPKLDNQLQRETNLPFDAGDNSKFVSREVEYPSFKSSVVKSGVQKKGSADAGVRFREPYDEQKDLSEDNVRMKYVKPGAIDHTSTQNF